MDGVAAEVAQEVAVLLQHHDLDAGARQQEAQHHAGEPAAHDAHCRAVIPASWVRSPSWPTGMLRSTPKDSGQAPC